MKSKISISKFSLGYSISSFLITLGTFTLFSSFTTTLFHIGANIIDIFIYLGFISGFSVILAFLAPLFGSISDKTKTRNRRKKYLIFGIVGMALTTLFYFFAPLHFGITSVTLNLIFFAIIHAIYLLSSIIYNINFICLFPESFQGTYSRTNVIALLLGFSALSAIIITFFEFFISFEEIYFGIIFGLIIILGGFTLFIFGYDEPYSRIKEKPEPNEYSSHKIFSSSNKTFTWFLIAFFFITISEQLISIALDYIWIINLNMIAPSLHEFTTLLINIIPSVSIILFLLYWKKLIISFGITKFLRVILLTLIIYSVALLFLSDLVTGLILACLIEASLSGISFVKLLFLAIIIDQYFLNTGKRREGTYFGINHTFNHISGFIGLYLSSFVSIIFIIPLSDFYIVNKFNITLTSLIFFVISIVLIKKIPLEKDLYDKIEKDVAELNI